MAKFAEIEPAAIKAFERLNRQSWYLDPSTVVFGLANSDETVQDSEKEAMAKAFLKTKRPTFYDLDRKKQHRFPS